MSEAGTNKVRIKEVRKKEPIAGSRFSYIKAPTGTKNQSVGRRATSHKRAGVSILVVAELLEKYIF